MKPDETIQPGAEGLSSGRHGAIQLTPLEIAFGVIIGDTHSDVKPLGSPEESPRRALEDAVLSGLMRPPCLVSFSGGRDSSAILAVASQVARREGLELPIPATNRFPSAPETDETAWQEEVIGHLGITEWHRVDFGDELDLVGPIASEALLRHGLLWPSNSHFHAPLLKGAAGGSLLTGIGGDEVFGWWPWARAAAVLSLRLRPEPRDLLRIGFALAPHPLKQAVIRRRSQTGLPWLRPDAQDSLRAASSAEDATMPISWRKRTSWLARRRYLQINLHSMNLHGADAGATLVHPFLDSRFLNALGAAGRRAGFADRTEVMHELFSDLVPESILSRESKTAFNAIFFNRYSSEFAQAWDGTGVDHDLVDPDVLRDVWLSETPDGRSSTLLQSAWLAKQAE